MKKLITCIVAIMMATFTFAVPSDSTSVSDNTLPCVARARRRAANTSESHRRSADDLKKKYRGQKKNIAILVNFPDLAMLPDNDKEAFGRLLNEKNYNDNYNAGSVRDYFFDQSYGMLDIEFDVYGPVTVSKNHSYYGEDSSSGYDSHPCELVEEACKLVKELGADFTKYDWDGDNEVDQVLIFFAGNSQAAYNSTYSLHSDYIWSHQFTMDEGREDNDGNGAFYIDKMRINSYAMVCELLGTSKKSRTTIGLVCHEFSHCFGLPDFYNLDSSSNLTNSMGYWDLLALGDKNGLYDGTFPCGLSAYERNFLGWLEFTELSKPCDIKNMPSIEDSPVAYIIYNDRNRNEYYTLENRQAGKWFGKGSGRLNNEAIEGLHGMLITHVYYDNDAWFNNLVNTNSLARMSYIPANKSFVRDGSYGQLFPGKYNVTELTADSHYNVGGYWYGIDTPKRLSKFDKPITNIRETNNMISFSFMGGDPTGIQPESDDDCAPRYFNMNGTPLQGMPATTGIYLMQKGDKTIKIRIK